MQFNKKKEKFRLICTKVAEAVEDVDPLLKSHNGLVQDYINMKD